MTEVQKKVELFAREVHDGHFRKGEAKEPYVFHIEEVVEPFKKYGGIETEICSAWLHDTVEDFPPTSFENIEEHFGAEVANSLPTNWSYEPRTVYIRWAYEGVGALQHKPENYELG